MSFNIENIITYFNDDLALKNADGESLRIFTIKNPYSGVLQLLYCRYLSLNNDVALESQLEKCSLVVADRKKVYELLFQPNVQEQIIEQETSFLKEDKNKETETENQVIQERDFDNNDILQKDTTLANKESTENRETEIEEFPVVPQKVIDELEKNILVEAVNSSIQIDVSDYKKLEKEEEIEPEITSAENKLEIEVENSEERAFINWFEKPKEKTQPIKEASKSSIIDNFLKTTKKSRKDEPKKKENIFSPTNVAKMSLVANNEFVTETLANIYARQGQIHKAIEIYKQLSLKYPEKKTFFASRIRFLNEKQKYNN